MVQLYIQHTDNNYYLLDLEESEAINYKLTVKDLSDITKIYAPFTQSFSLKATDKNKILCGFIGNEKIQQVNNTREFNCKIYIAGFLFQSGVLKFKETDYELKDQKGFKTNFASNLTGLSDKLGDTTIQELFDLTDPTLSLDWSHITLKERMTSVTSKTMANGVNLKVGIPFISNNRVWTWNEDNLSIVDNIAYKKDRTETSVNQIELTEVRPAISYMTIMQHLLLKIGSPVICPLFDVSIVKDLFVWCSSENLVLPKTLSFPLINYNALTYLRYDTKDEIIDIDIPANPKWQITGGLATGVFKVKRDPAAYYPNKWSDGFDINLTFNGLEALEGNATKIKVVLKNATNGVEIDSKEIDGNLYTYRLLDPIGGTSILDTNGELFFKFEILPITLVKWSNIEMKTVQKFRYETKGVLGIKRVTRASFSATSINGTSSEMLGGNKINLVSTLPEMKCIDFLKSFFSTFNISVLSTGKPDNSMYWVTTNDIHSDNNEYSKRLVDYTRFVDIASFNKKEANEFNQYSFTHFASKYYDSLYGDGTAFGALQYPTTPPTKPTKFEVKTNYSIIKQATTFVHPSGARTCLAFSKENPEILENGGVRYKPVFGEFTIFYLQPKDLTYASLALEYTKTANAELFGVLEASYKDSKTGKILGFGATDADTDSLYLNYYKKLIERLLKPNTFLTEFALNLPPNEIFLNFANLNQGESNIPTGFRAQNEIIIGEQRYELADAAIDLTTGKTKLTLLNY